MCKAQAVGWGTGRGSGQPEKIVFHGIIIAKKILKKSCGFFFNFSKSNCLIPLPGYRSQLSAPRQARKGNNAKYLSYQPF